MKFQPTRLVVALALSSVAGVATAQTFTATANVTNAIAITQTTPLNFGNLFATATKIEVAAGAAVAADSARLTLTPQGTITNVLAGNAPPVLSLGGQTAGVYQIPGLPIGSDIVVEIQSADGEPITNGTASSALCNYDEAVDAIADDRVVLTAGGPGSGNFSGFFCVDAFTARIGTTDVTATLLNTSGTGYDVPGASGGTVTFSLGATIIGSSGATETLFEQAAYSGEFNMEVQFK